MAKTYKQKYMKNHPGSNFEKDVLPLYCPDDISFLQIPNGVSKQFCKIFKDNCAECWNQTDWK